MMVTSIVNVLNGIFEAIIIFMFINTYARKRNSEHSFSLCVITVLMLATTIIVSNLFVKFTMSNIIFIGIAIIVIAFIYNRQILPSILLAALILIILAITENIVLFLMTYILNLTVEQVTMVDNYRVWGIVFSKLFAYIILKIICINHKQNHSFKMKPSYWLLFLTMFISSVMSIFLIFKLQLESGINNMYTFSVLCSFGLLYSTFFAIYLYENLSKQIDIERKQEMFKQQIKDQAKHLDEILITQQEIKKIRHDLNNHNISIQAFFETQNYKDGLEYMKNMNRLTDLSNDFIDTGNIALDAIMNTKKSIAASKNIHFETNIQIPEKLFVDAIDICIIFGNALDNCIEACELINNGDKKISVSIIYEDKSIICKIVNTSLKRNKDFLKTIKDDKINHGFGIENIESALSKYKNICRFKQTDTEFILSFIIFEN